MDETLWSGVSDKFKNTFGAVSAQKRAITSLYDWGGYVIYTRFGNADLNCYLGYYLPNEDPAKFPWVGVWLSCKPKSTVREKVVSAFRKFLLKTGNEWKPENLDDEREWSKITKGRQLQTFLGESDHVQAIKAYFLDLLDEVATFKSEHPELPWSTSAADAEDE